MVPAFENVFLASGIPQRNRLYGFGRALRAEREFPCARPSREARLN